MFKIRPRGKAVEIGLIVVFFGSALLSMFRNNVTGASVVNAATAATTLDVRVAAGNNDAEQRLSDGFMYIDSSDLEMVNDPGVTKGDQSVGMRFTGVSVPKGATITRAYVEYQVDEASSEATSLVLHAEATDNPAAFTTSAHNITSRVRTAASAAWSSIPAWTSVGAKVQTPDLSGVVQEIVNRGGWSAGNALVILVDGSGRRVASSFEAGGTIAPLLHIEYIPAGSPTQPPASPTNTPLPTNTPVNNPAGSSLDARVTTGNDDAEQRLSDGHMYLNSSDLEMVNDNGVAKGVQSVGMRFTGIAVPKGASITRAYIEFQVDESTSEATSLVVHGQAVDNAAGFTNASNNVTSREKTSASVSWNNIPAWTSVGAKVQSPDLSGVVQEIVNRGGWTSGNAMVLIVDGTGRRVGKAYESGASTAPLLHIEFSTSGGVPQPTAQPSPTPTNTQVATSLPPTPTSTPVNPPSSSSLDVRVATGNDDSEQRLSDGFMYLNSSDLELIYDPGVTAGNQSIGMRFTGVNIPKGVTITRAYVEFQVDETSSEATSLTLRGEAADNSAGFTSSAYNVTNRPKTAASVSWNNIPAWMTVGGKIQSPDLSSVVQEVVNRGGWTSGNALVIFVDGAGRRVSKSYEAGASTSPLLHVEYLASGGSVQPSPTPTSTPVVNPTPNPTSSSQPLPVGQTGSWRMVFNDEFNGTSLDSTKWRTCFWWADTTCSIETNKELELYNPDDVLVGNGMLTLRAQKRNMTAWNGTTYNYTSGMVMSGGRSGKIPPEFSFTYGYAEARVLVPKGKGLWPAFWMLPTSYSSRPEIDIMEILGDTTSAYHMNYHYVGGDAGYTWTGPDFSADWHVIGINWQPDAITWYVDGVQRWQYTNTANISKEPEYLLLNLAVGGTWPGSPDANTPFPSYFNIDYVRVWQK